MLSQSFPNKNSGRASSTRESGVNVTALGPLLIAEGENVYFIRAKGAGFIKIGCTQGNGLKRLVELQIGCPFELEFLGLLAGKPGLELRVHPAEEGSLNRCPRCLTTYPLGGSAK